MSFGFDARAVRLRRQREEASIEHLKRKNPQKFAAAQVTAYEQGKVLSELSSQEQRQFGNPNRMALVLQILDVQAATYLELVDDMASHESYVILLNAFGNKAFENQTGMPIDAIMMMASEDEVQAIRARVAHWVNEGYKRVASPPAVTTNDGDERERRRALLDDYRGATGNPTDHKIYESENCPIHKPDFFKWRSGELPASSATAQNFERFLKEKKPPKPRI